MNYSKNISVLNNETKRSLNELFENELVEGAAPSITVVNDDCQWVAWITSPCVRTEIFGGCGLQLIGRSKMDLVEQIRSILYPLCEGELAQLEVTIKLKGRTVGYTTYTDHDGIKLCMSLHTDEYIMW